MTTLIWIGIGIGALAVGIFIGMAIVANAVMKAIMKGLGW